MCDGIADEKPAKGAATRGQKSANSKEREAPTGARSSQMANLAGVLPFDGLFTVRRAVHILVVVYIMRNNALNEVLKNCEPLWLLERSPDPFRLRMLALTSSLNVI